MSFTKMGAQRLPASTKETPPVRWDLFSADYKVRLWNRKGELSAVLDKHTLFVNTVSFSPDGHRIETASIDICQAITKLTCVQAKSRTQSC